MKTAKEIPEMDIKDIVRFISSIEFSKKCWVFKKGKKNKSGYCDFHFKGKSYSAHRVSYEFFTKDKIPLDYAIDHLCKNPPCVNPSHLEVVTHSENTRRGNGISSIFKRRDSCIRGHKYTAETVRWRRSRVDNSKTWRICKVCTNSYMKDYQTEQRKQKKLVSTLKN